jgi:hypothetical protein
MVALGLGLCSWGSLNLLALAGAYRSTDLALTEQPASFRAWLLGVVAEPDQTHTTRRIAKRLLAMPLASRRNAADAMAGREFWEPFAGQEGGPKKVQRQVRDGILLALQSSPAAGDLYLTAAWLESLTDGFGLRGRELLRASHIFAPRELSLVRGRLRFAALVWPLLGPSDHEALRKDFVTYRNAEPGPAAKLRAVFALEGIEIE